MDCIFCKIIKGDVPCDKVYEDKDVIAFLDIAPIIKGHTLVILKNHHETILDVPEEELCNLIAAGKKVCQAVYKATKSDGFNFSMNNYEASGQAVPHAHFHIIPRFENDGLSHWPHGKYDEGEPKDFVDKIKKEL